MLNYKKPAFRIIIAAVVACIVLAVCILTNPVKEPELDNVESIMINGASVSDIEKSELVLMINNHKKTKFPVGADDPDSHSTAVEIRLADGSMWVLHYQNYNGIKLDINSSGIDKRAIITRFNASGKAEDSWRIEASFNIDFEEWYSSQSNGSLQNDHSYREGLYLPCDNGVDMIIIDDYGPVSMTPDNDSITFDGLTAGDKIRIEVYLIQELYPMQAVIYSIEKLSDGEHGDIDTDIISSLTELGWLDNKSKESQKAEQLTLENVISLSKKGDALMWSDFDSYAHIDTGSGLYIRVYTIDDTFSVWIGGGSTDEKPMYIYLAAGKQGEPRIDIRTDDVEAFIKDHQSKSSNTDNFI
ncbi:MAG: hypothetical protein ACYCWE_02435 [Eubacteriales bacterium]